MIDFLRNLHIERISFWLGFLAGSLFWWLLGKLRPLFALLRQRLYTQAQTARQEVLLGNEIRLGNDTISLAQEWHLAAPLFSLNEIIIPPRFLSPPVPIEPGEPTSADDVTDWAIPYLPDWPELASLYGAPTLSLAEALQGGANLAIIGQPGSGKTVALAHLATQIAQRQADIGELSQYLPLLIHAADLILPPRNPDKLTDTLFDAIAEHVSSLNLTRLSKILESAFEQKRALLLLDGLDELSPPLFDEVVQYLKELLEKHPGTRTIVAASPNYLGGLSALGFIPISIASWNLEQRSTFIKNWGDLWSRFVAPATKEEAGNPDSMLVHGWLLTETALLTPLELTLKVWAAFAGDSIGPSPIEAIEAYLRRMTLKQPAKNRRALEQLASQMTLNLQPVVDRKGAEAWLSGASFIQSSSEELDIASQEEQSLADSSSQKVHVRAPGALSDLIESGLIISHIAGRVTLINPVLAGYLAGQFLSQSGEGNQLIGQTGWVGKIQALHYMAVTPGQESWINEMLDDEDTDPLLEGLFTTSRWLRDATEKTQWTSIVMRKLAGCLQKENLPVGIKARAMSALVLSGNPGVIVLLRQLLQSIQDEVRQLAILGLGLLRDVKAIEDINKLLDDPSPKVNRAVLLALVAIGDKAALETVAYALLHGDDGIRRAAAEALSNHLEEGHPTLEEGSNVNDPAVRRAVAYGLGRINLPWAITILEKMRAEDSQWVVQDAATHIIETLQESNPRIPRPLPPLTHTPWLIAFAGEHGMGVAPGKPAFDLLYMALKDGKEEQRLAAVNYLSRNCEESAVLPLYSIYFASRGELREAALNALWHLSAAGINLPPPVQFGLK